MSPTLRNMLHWMARIILGGVFIYAGARKMARTEEFSDSIVGFQILPLHLVNLVALTLPILEITLGFSILIPKSGILRTSSLGLIGLNGLFIGVLTVALVRGIAVDCGCFGFQIFPLSAWTIPLAILRDIILFVIAIVLWGQASKAVVAKPSKSVSSVLSVGYRSEQNVYYSSSLLIRPANIFIKSLTLLLFSAISNA